MDRVEFLKLRISALEFGGTLLLSSAVGNRHPFQ
jgi:hypothetical protein